MAIQLSKIGHSARSGSSGSSLAHVSAAWATPELRLPETARYYTKVQ